MPHNRPNTIDASILPESPRVAASVGLPDRDAVESPHTPATVNGFSQGATVCTPNLSQDGRLVKLELQDGSSYMGTSFGAEKSVSGELVFQTGMVGYPESITDPSYRGQLLVMTFPLVGNYGVPSREDRDALLGDLPAFFEAAEIHVSGMIVASYSGEDYSHHLAKSSLGAWLKEQGVPAMCGVDTRALTKRIREEGSMLGKMVLADGTYANTITNGESGSPTPGQSNPGFERVDWVDPNTKNLVADGERIPHFLLFRVEPDDRISLYSRPASILSIEGSYLETSDWETLENSLRRRWVEDQSITLLRRKRHGGTCSAMGL